MNRRHAASAIRLRVIWVNTGSVMGTPPSGKNVDVDVIERGDSVYLNEGMFEIRVPEKFKAVLGPRKGEKMCLGIRPEDIYDKLFYTLGPKEGNIFSATVEVVEPLGAETIVHLRVNSDALIVTALGTSDDLYGCWQRVFQGGWFLAGGGSSRTPAAETFLARLPEGSVDPGPALSMKRGGQTFRMSAFCM